jgi:hypothetical protein
MMAAPLRLTFITRQDCCLCEEMKPVVDAVAAEYDAAVDVCDVDADPALLAQFSDAVPVLLVNGRKAFKYRVSAAALRRRLAREQRAARGRRLR